MRDRQMAKGQAAVYDRRTALIERRYSKLRHDPTKCDLSGRETGRECSKGRLAGRVEWQQSGAWALPSAMIPDLADSV
jgi:hypothetical protein